MKQPNIHALIATRGTDKKLAAIEREKGRAARQSGASRDSCPWKGGMCWTWWTEGWDGATDVAPLDY